MVSTAADTEFNSHMASRLELSLLGKYVYRDHTYSPPPPPLDCQALETNPSGLKLRGNLHKFACVLQATHHRRLGVNFSRLVQENSSKSIISELCYPREISTHLAYGCVVLLFRHPVNLLAFECNEQRLFGERSLLGSRSQAPILQRMG